MELAHALNHSTADLSRYVGSGRRGRSGPWTRRMQRPRAIRSVGTERTVNKISFGRSTTDDYRGGSRRLTCDTDSFTAGRESVLVLVLLLGAGGAAHVSRFQECRGTVGLR